jgi:exosortase/archaeosortase family protein
LGLPAYAQGNQIHGVAEGPLGVEEACSGLGMMMVFFALTTAVVYLATNRPIVGTDNGALSAAPIAVMANLIRITTTGVFMPGATIGPRKFCTITWRRF